MTCGMTDREPTPLERLLSEELERVKQERDALKVALHEVAYANRTRNVMKALAKQALHGGMNG